MHGEWHLWIYLGTWAIRGPARGLCTRDVPSRFVGQSVCRVDIDAQSAATTFVFDDLELRVAADDPDDELWLLYVPGGRVLSVRGTGEFTRGPADEPGKPWRSLADGPP